MKFFAVKSEAGYLKNNAPAGLKTVGLEQASVFGESKLSQAEEMADRARKAGFTGVRVVELSVVEKSL